MKFRHDSASEAQLLVQLVEKTKARKASGIAGEEVLSLKCPCGVTILPPTPAIPSLKDRQRGMVRSKIERHLRDDHGLSKHTIGVVLKESFARD
jgi:hypothetical protein